MSGPSRAPANIKRYVLLSKSPITSVAFSISDPVPRSSFISSMSSRELPGDWPLLPPRLFSSSCWIRPSLPVPTSTLRLSATFYWEYFELTEAYRILAMMLRFTFRSKR